MRTDNGLGFLKTVGACALVGLAALGIRAQGAEAELSGPQIVERVKPSVALILAGDGAGRVLKAASAVVVRSDGILLTAHHGIKHARQVQVRLSSGEVYDQIEVLAVDERRDVAALRIPALRLPAVPVVPVEEVSVGERVFVLSGSALLGWSASDGLLSAVRMADEVPGAGAGYRLLQFTAPVSPGSSGGVLVDGQGRALGIVVASISGQNNNFAVPVESVLGLIQGAGGDLESGLALRLPADRQIPQPIDLEEVERPELVRAARGVYIVSRNPYFLPASTLAEALLKRKEFRAWGFMLVQEERAADLMIEIDYPLGFWDFTFTVSDRKTSVVLASGHVIAWDGIRAAPLMAKKIIAGLQDALQASVPDLKRR